MRTCVRRLGRRPDGSKANTCTYADWECVRRRKWLVHAEYGRHGLQRELQRAPSKWSWGLARADRRELCRGSRAGPRDNRLKGLGRLARTYELRWLLG